MDINKELERLQEAETKAYADLDIAQRNLRAFINNNNLNEKELVWPTNERIDNIGPNGNTGEHYG